MTDFIRAWRQGEGQACSANAFVPLAFELGEAFQFDWSEEGLVVGGIYYRMQVSHMKLCASRAFWLVAYPSQGHEMLFDAHTRSFAALGGVARRGIYDNMKTAVDKVKKGKGRIVNERFADDVRALPVRPRLLQRRLWLGEGRRREERAGQPAAHLDRRGQAALRQLHRTQRLAGPALPGAVGRGAPPRARAVQRGRDARARAAAPDAHARRRSTATSRSRRACPAPAWCRWRATATRCRASWSGRWSARGCTRAAWSWWPTTRWSASHERLSDAGQTRYDWQHYIPLLQRKPGALRNGAPFADMPEPLQQLRRALLRNPGGDRVMAQVLAIVLTAGLDAVLVAVELALETGPPGKVSVEHVVNVLGRLNAAPAPQTAATSLQVTTAAAGQHGALRQPARRQHDTTEEAGHDA